MGFDDDRLAGRNPRQHIFASANDCPYSVADAVSQTSFGTNRRLARPPQVHALVDVVKQEAEEERNGCACQHDHVVGHRKVGDWQREDERPGVHQGSAVAGLVSSTIDDKEQGWPIDDKNTVVRNVEAAIWIEGILVHAQKTLFKVEDDPQLGVGGDPQEKLDFCRPLTVDCRRV